MAEARAMARQIAKRLRVPGASKIIPVGSVRRGVAARVGDLDFLCVGRSLPRLDGAVLDSRVYTIARTTAAGDRRRGLIVAHAKPDGSVRRFRADLFAATTAELPFALFHYTGSHVYNIRVRAHAKRDGLKLNQYGLFDVASGRRVRGVIKTEKQLALRLGVTYKRPAEREEM